MSSTPMILRAAVVATLAAMLAVGVARATEAPCAPSLVFLTSFYCIVFLKTHANARLSTILEMKFSPALT